jgi:hypothetical protein
MKRKSLLLFLKKSCSKLKAEQRREEQKRKQVCCHSCSAPSVTCSGLVWTSARRNCSLSYTGAGGFKWYQVELLMAHLRKPLWTDALLKFPATLEGAVDHSRAYVE